MNNLNLFFDSTNALLNEMSFIRKHSISSSSFTRVRCLTLQKTWWCMMAHGSASLQSEIPLIFYKFKESINRFTPQAYSKARNKMQFTACKEIFELTSKYLWKPKSFKGFNLAAVDGSRILPPDTSEIRNALGVCGNHIRTRAGALVSILYDPLSDHIINGTLTHSNMPERQCLYDLIEQAKLKNTIIILDRGYPSKDVYRFLNKHNLKYVIRMGIGPHTPNYVRNAKKSDQIVTDDKNNDITQRIIRFKLSDNTEELLLSNIYDKSFTINDFKKIYHLRWSVETKYDEIKNKFNLEKFTGKSLNSVLQDFYNVLTKSNIIAYIRSKATAGVKTTGHAKKIGIQSSIKMFFYYIPLLLCDQKNRKTYVNEIFSSLQHMLIPIRPNRSFARNKKHTDRKYRNNLK